ncbi:putative cell division control protein CDC3 [Kickxella alabastrina]|uniref:putative cell division control protein CDC3 n=1 Tax=Kickxella alabastrina TaxID=61397 RepID=UPI00221FA3D1|nr:putative cell division control protein CDC3 [Kickxella alabastrina]KAI7826280.1 putative cell division control protein CDC3 [Kickxella alabastrina]
MKSTSGNAGGAQKKKMHGYVGFSNYPNQIHRRSVKNGFNFTLMVVGESGIGKSTLINTLFDSKIFSDREELPPNADPIKGVDITSMSADIQENGVKLRLTVVDTPGFGDSINNEDAWQPILENIESRFDAYLAQENRVNRSKISDNRIDAVIYFVKPTGHCLRAIDIEFMKRLHTKVNLIPIVAKADTLTAKELEQFKTKLLADINYHGIQIFKPVSDEFDDAETVADNRSILNKIPFAVMFVERPDGTSVRGRSYPWGIIEVESEEHNDFMKLRQMLLRTHMEELKDSTDIKLLSMGHVQDNGVFREYNPVVQIEEDRRAHEAKMNKMEGEMTAVFQQKVQEKESKLKQSEEELYARHKEMKTVLEKQRSELDEKKRRAEATVRPTTPMEQQTTKGKKKNIFSGF